MDRTKVKQIVTHENPDIDAMMSVLLLKRFGETRFPGSSAAEVIFCPAGELPGGLTAGELEKKGIIAVDVGGGDLDTHPVGTNMNEAKQERSAADLVAEAVNVINNPYWSPLIEYTRLQDVNAQSLQSRDFIHHLFALPNILMGITLKNKKNSLKILNEGIKFLEVIPLYLEKKSKGEDDFEVLEFIKTVVRSYMNQRQITPDDKSKKYENFLEWRRRLFENPAEAFSTIEMDEMISLPALVKGTWYKQQGNEKEVANVLETVFDMILEREAYWQDALEQLDTHAVHKKIRKINVVSIVSQNGMVMKAARFRMKADLIIYSNPENRAITVMVKRQGPLRKFSLRNLAAKIRVAECIEKGQKPNYKSLWKVGTVHGWFLHQSENLLIRGSSKATEFIPSRISVDHLTGLAISEIDWNQKIPAAYCPDNYCKGLTCNFFTLDSITCKNHQKKHGIAAKAKNSNFGNKLMQALRDKS